MLTIHVKLAIATFILLPFITIALSYFNKNDKANTDIYDNLGEFNAGIEASVSGIRVTQSLQMNHLNENSLII